MATPSAIPVATQTGSLLRVVSPQQLADRDRAEAEAAAAAAQEEEASLSQLASFVRGQLAEMRNFRDAEGIAQRLIDSLRTYRGQYPPHILTEIKKFGGSEVYARLTATKCRAATALLRDVYLGPEPHWALTPTPEPVIPDDINRSIDELVNTEVATLQQSGQPVDQQMIDDRVMQLRKAAKRASKKKAVEEAAASTSVLNDLLVEGGYYEALAEFLIDLPIFPYAVIKGPVVRNIVQTKWQNGAPMQQRAPKMFWERVSPFDLYWSPGASRVQHANFIERIRLSRADLTQLRGVPGYDDDAITQVLERFWNSGLSEWWSSVETERRDLEERERWGRATSSTLIDCAEFTGFVSGRLLRDWGMPEEKVPDEVEEYFVTAWLIDRWVIKVQINPYTTQRAPYYISSFEKIPGGLIGAGLPELLEDVQTVCNATVRSLVNNLSISSGPQVVINREALLPGAETSLYPWKRWEVSYDPNAASSARSPVEFFQPNSNSQDLLMVFEKFSIMADEISSLPRYMVGNERVGGAGRTASGLAMLMGNASKTLQNVAATIDRDVIEPLITYLYDMVMLTQPGLLRGDEVIDVRGVNHAVKREQDRMRQLEFLQLTANPIDMAIVGPQGRANVLRSVAQNLGLDHERTVPSDEELTAQMNAVPPGGPSPGAGPPGMIPPGQQPSPADARAAAEEVRRPVEGEFVGPTGRPGMRMGG
jgi:hypothetical protein